MACKSIYSIGSSTRGPREFVELLKAYKIETLADVRRFPTSRFEHFVEENLERILKGAGIEYIFLGDELGGMRRTGYEDYTTTEDFKEGVSKLEEIAEDKRTAFMCAERLPWKCHRRFIGFALRERGWRVIHIIEEKRVWEPKDDSGPDV